VAAITLDLADSNDVGAYRHTVQFFPLFIGNANRATYIVTAVFCEIPHSPGGVSFRAFQVREKLPVYIHVHAAFPANVKEKSGHRDHSPPSNTLIFV
jgi:hypothetical protein